MKPYTQYVNFMLRQVFARDGSLTNRTIAEVENDTICLEVLRGRSEQERNILREIVSASEHVPMREAVRRFALDRQMDEKDTWSLVRKTTEEIARRKGLI